MVLGVHEPYKDIMHPIPIDNPSHIGKHFLGKINYKPEIPTVVLKNNAHALDLMKNPSIIGFSSKQIVSSKLKNIFEEYGAKDFQFFKLNVFQKKKELQGYWLMHPCKEHIDMVDFKKSDFYVSGVIKAIEKIKIKSVLHFKQIREEIWKNGYKKSPIASLAITKIVINENCNKTILKLNHVKDQGSFFVNEVLKEEIEKKECTGIEFMPLNITKEEFFREGGYRHKVYGYWP